MNIDSMEILSSKVYGIQDAILISSFPKATDIDINRTLDYQDEKRAKYLANAKIGSGHDCFLKGIVVVMIIKAKAKWWMQFDRYHFQDTISSTSVMHKIIDMDLDEWLPNTIYECTRLRLKADIEKYRGIEHNIKIYKDAGDVVLYNEYKKMADELFEIITDNVPKGLYYTRGIVLNYLQLKSMVEQRKSHRLEHWHKFINHVRTLPMAKELIFREG